MSILLAHSVGNLLIWYVIYWYYKTTRFIRRFLNITVIVSEFPSTPNKPKIVAITAAKMRTQSEGLRSSSLKVEIK